VTNQQMQIVEIRFIIHWYSPTCVGRLCVQHQGALQVYG